MKKNIVIVVSAMNMGGAQRVVSILCNHWSQNGYVITLISTFSGEKINHYQLNKDVALKYLSNTPFFPKNKGEADIVQLILKDLENGMLPRVGGVGATKVSGRKLSAPFFQSPRHWTIDFFTRKGQKNDYLFQIKKSVITAMTVNHDQQSTVSLHNKDEKTGRGEGAPVQTTLSLTFQEIELVVSGDKGNASYFEGATVPKR